MTGIYAQELEPNSLFDAYKSRRTIVTQGQRIAIDFRINDLFIGDSDKIDNKPTISVKVKSPSVLEYIEILRDGEVIKRFETGEKTVSEKFTDSDAAYGRHFYYVKVKTIGDPSYNEEDSDKKEYTVPFVSQGRYPFNFARAHGPFAWTTPIWVEYE